MLEAGNDLSGVGAAEAQARLLCGKAGTVLWDWHTGKELSTQGRRLMHSCHRSSEELVCDCLQLTVCGVFAIDCV